MEISSYNTTTIKYTAKERDKVIKKIQSLIKKRWELCDYNDATQIPSDEEEIKYTTITLIKRRF